MYEKLLKNIFFGILFVIVFSFGIISLAYAHPHATIDLMDSHSHDNGMEENFLIHTFEQVVFSIVDFVNGIFVGKF